MSNSPYHSLLRNHLDLKNIPFSERGSRIMLLKDRDRFALRLAERWMAWEGQYGHYRRRSSFLKDLELADADGHCLPAELTTYPHLIEAQTAIGTFRWVFADEETICLEWPPAPCGVRFCVQAVTGQTDRRGGTFKGDPAHRRTHRNFAYTTAARIVSNRISGGEDGYQTIELRVAPAKGTHLQLNVTPRLGFNRALRPFEQLVGDSERRWQAWFDRAPALDIRRLADVPVPPDVLTRQYYYAWWCMASGLVSPRFFATRESMIPSKTWYVGIWHWDAFFHALAYRHVDARLAEDQLRILIDHQRADGMIPDAVHDEGVVFEFALPNSTRTAEVTKPPLLAWTALKLYAASGNLDFLHEIYEPLTRLNNWWFEHNDDDHDGVVQYNHPYSSGLDDSPLWDEGTPIESPDINTYLVMQMDEMARIAELIGATRDVPLWRERAASLTERIIAHFWDESAGLFRATKDGRPLLTTTLFNLFPLLTRRLPQAMNDRLVAHLTAPQEFWPPYPLPTVSMADPAFDPNQMWRGPTWVNINYLFIEGLRALGYETAARELRRRTLTLLTRQPDIYEYYNPLDGCAPPKAASIFGWSSSVLIELALDTVDPLPAPASAG